MYGLITRLTAKTGQREALAQLMVGGLSHRPGCLSYVVSLDPASQNGIWVTEVWTDEAAHKVSLAAPEIKAFTTRGWSMVATMEESIVTEPIGGVALA